MNDGVDVLLADPPGDQLCVLRTEIENEDGLRWGLHFRILRETKWPPVTAQPAACLKKEGMRWELLLRHDCP